MSEGGDSGPWKYRMSTTVSGPLTSVVRRTMPSGCRYAGDPSFGVTHPFTHSGDASARLGGGRSGNAGGVTEGVTLEDPVGVSGGGGVLVLGEPPSPPPSQATSAAPSASATRSASGRNLRGCTGSPGGRASAGYRPASPLVA